MFLILDFPARFVVNIPLKHRFLYGIGGNVSERRIHKLAAGTIERICRSSDEGT